MNTNNIDEYVALQLRAFNLLEVIANLQLKAADNAKTANNVTDYDRYKIKIELYFKGLSDAVKTLDLLLKNLKNVAELSKKIGEIEKVVAKLNIEVEE